MQERDHPYAAADGQLAVLRVDRESLRGWFAIPCLILKPILHQIRCLLFGGLGMFI